jgi:hypothetical protein
LEVKQTSSTVIQKAIWLRRRRFQPDIIRYAVWRHFRFILSFRDVEERWLGGELASSYPTTRAEDAGLQVSEGQPQSPGYTRRRLQHLHHLKSYRPPQNTSSVQSRRARFMGGSHHCRLIQDGTRPINSKVLT